MTPNSTAEKKTEVQSVPTPQRIAAVEKARQSWIGRLVDLSRRNNLLYFRDLKVGTVDMSAALSEGMRELLQSGRLPEDGVRLTELFPRERRQQVALSLREVAARARSNFEERGLDTLFLAIGLATWKSEDGGRDASAPVLLIPVEVIPRGLNPESWKLRRAGEVKVSDVLLHALSTEYNVTVDAEAMIVALQGDDAGEEFDPGPTFAHLQVAATGVPEFRIEPRWVLGNFAFQKMSIVRDLKDLLEALARHDLVAALAGDRDAASSALSQRVNVDASELDKQPPDNEFLIRDADSSQHRAIAAILRGQSGVISGPPGTGKSQTISNLIAELIARGNTVLFVAEKRAALEVVLNRLKQADLGHLCLDCHGADLSRKAIAQQLQESLQVAREAPQVEVSNTHSKFVDRRDRLNAHVRLMHEKRSPAEMSLYALYGAAITIPVAARTQVRFSGPRLKMLTNETIRVASQELDDLSEVSELVLWTSDSPWVSATFRDQVGVRNAIEASRQLRDLAPDLIEAGRAFEAESLLRPAKVGDLRKAVAVLTNLDELLQRFDASIFESGLPQLASLLKPSRSLVGRFWATIFRPAYRKALYEVRGKLKSGRIRSDAALTAVEQAESVSNSWRELGGRGIPRSWKSASKLRKSWNDSAQSIRSLESYFPAGKLDELTIQDLVPFIAALAADVVTPGKQLRKYELINSISEKGLGSILSEISTRKIAQNHWVALLRFAWVSSCIEEIQISNPSVASFRGRKHDDIVKEFQKLHNDRLTLAIDRVRRAHALKVLSSRNQFPNQSAVVEKEAHKKSRHLPLRKLFSDASDVLVSLRPCWMASPLSVSQLIPGDRPYFDVVIFDEASQVLPEDAVTSLLRGRRAVVAGDQKQLPPTTFFATASENNDDEEDDTAGFESILDQMSSFLSPPWSLDWHYRSRDESLISYSNHKIYGGRLVTFPGALTEPAIRFVPVHQNAQAGQEHSTSAEVQRVVELVIEHARMRPHESLGVITMGIVHANRIEAALYSERENHPDLDDFFAVEQAERFFIKNLERVQGDERDAIILSIGYGKNDAGHVVYRFGPLLQAGGERRLNVAITRARSRMTVVSSLSHSDLDPDYKKDGVKHLRSYLEYAASGGRTFGITNLGEVSLNDFEQSVHDELTRAGLSILPQVGSSRYRIDLVAVHPSKAGRLVLAIECDGASYHAGPTARDRDRLRQQQLEALGWRFCRIWSTDWFLRREEETQRVLKAFSEAVKIADQIDAAGGLFDNDEETVPPAKSANLATPKRTSKPYFKAADSIDGYISRDIERVIRWVQSDGILRTDEEILQEVVVALGFKRRGPRIVDRLRREIQKAGPALQ